MSATCLNDRELYPGYQLRGSIRLVWINFKAWMFLHVGAVLSIQPENASFTSNRLFGRFFHI